LSSTLERSIDLDHNTPVFIPGANPKDAFFNSTPTNDEYLSRIKRIGKLAGGQTARPVAPAIPFIAAAHEHQEPFPIISEEIKAKNPAITTEFNVPSYGYLRAIWLDVKMNAQTGVTAEEALDAPFVTLGAITLLDTNGAPIYGPLSGYNAFLTNVFGGYAYQQDPRNLPLFTAFATSGEFRYQFRIPVEISHHDGTGCIGNQNASAPYRVRFTIESPEKFYKKEPEAFKVEKNLTIRPYLESWSLPNAQDALGRPQAQLPPNYGTVQYWSERVQSGLVAGLNNVQVLRVGNLIRNLIVVGRKTSSTGQRDDKVLPEFPIINWDARQLKNESLAYRINRSYEPIEALVANFIRTTATSGSAKMAGVLAYTWDRSNQDRAGDDKPWLWIPTVEATRFELTGNWEEAGVNVVLINDIAPAEVNPTQRYALPSATGFHPETGARNPNIP
jgi:hypothetical protein